MAKHGKQEIVAQLERGREWFPPDTSGFEEASMVRTLSELAEIVAITLFLCAVIIIAALVLTTG